MKILHITDSHGTGKSPEGRTDIYYLSFLKKLYELKYVIKSNDIKLIIHTGDLFHSPRVSDKFAGQVAEIIKSYGVPMYVVPGNHDIDGYSLNTLDQTKLGLFYKTGVVKELDRNSNPIQIRSDKENLTINISGQEYYKDIDTGNMQDFEMRTTKSADFNILAIHGYLCDKPQHPDVICTLCSNIVTDADVILSGHFHESFTYQGGDFSVYNPGSLMRVEQTSYNKNHLPQYGILEVVNNNNIISHTYTLCPFRIAEPSEKVFDYTTKYEKKRTLITLENFKNSIANTNLNDNLSVAIENIIADVAQNLSVTDDVTKKTVDVYHDAYNNSPDKLEVQQGFVSDIQRKVITSVTIDNFQSHEQTFVQFKEGLNVIIGESNSGKTSILRAIRWALDNDPKGSDFITTGHEDCQVTVNFSDGTYIIRQRTRKESGTYLVKGKVIQPDGSITYWSDTYKGFGDNIPVEVSNIHQMPKVNLTKDVCTHLNMMSQLDGPFLIIDSPQTRAAIIGRLTGTQIIDLAVKETNSKILNNSKTIKILDAQKQEKEQALLQYSDIHYHEEFAKLVSCIQQDFIRKEAELDSLSNNLGIALTLEARIEDMNDSIQKDICTIKASKLQISILQYLEEQKKIFDLHNDFKEAKRNVFIYNQTLKWLILISSFKPFLENNSLKINALLSIIKDYIKVKTLKNNILSGEKTCNEINDKINAYQKAQNFLLNIKAYCNEQISMINNISSLHKDISDQFKQVNMLNSKISSYDEQIDDTKKQINKFVKQQKDLIKKNNICPCCGQPIIDDKCISNINKFMKGR